MADNVRTIVRRMGQRSTRARTIKLVVEIVHLVNHVAIPCIYTWTYLNQRPVVATHLYALCLITAPSSRERGREIRMMAHTLAVNG